MTYDYTIKYKSENTYENQVFEAHWQFMISPENNSTQTLLSSQFKSSVDSKIEDSINGYNFQSYRIHCKKPFDTINFEAEFKLVKVEINPFEFATSQNDNDSYEIIEKLDFKIDNESFLTPTKLTQLSAKNETIYKFDKSLSLVDNLIALNNWAYLHLFFKVGVTDVNTTLDEIIDKRNGVCQDFSHLFIAIARKNNIPARYVSGYLHQGDGFFGDSQMHAWVEAYVPNLGWIGFDPTNNLLANHNHIKVSHGRDYNDCPPIKGVIYSSGKNETKYSVEVSYQQ
ncbi:transglutaminase-like domain-containing protein [Paucihalobacter sp.]|uniref:transglutaminase-like domain-containing protein n=1 Tax=Paucihalobacter sp. TaxID=2850405 RepID=UPI002FE1293A